MKDLSTEEFKEAMKQETHFKRCEICGAFAIGEINLPQYGIPTASVKCRDCKITVSTPIKPECFTTKKSLGTPITAKTIGEAVKKVADAWNMLKK